MSENRPNPQQVTSQQYIRDVDAVREELYTYSAICKQIETLEENIKRDSRAAEEPTLGQKIKALKWYILIIFPLWFGTDVLINATLLPTGQMAKIPSIICYAVIAYVVYVIYLWFRPYSAYQSSAVYQQELQAIEEKRQEINQIQLKRSNAESKIVKKLYYVPRKYMNEVSILKLETYMKQYGASTLAEAIDILEKKQ